MLIGRLRIGTTVGTGVTVDAIERVDGHGRKDDHGAYSKITLSTRRTITLHKSTKVADLFVGHLPARAYRASTMPQVKDVRVSSREWRGERDGVPGERLTAIIPQYRPNGRAL